jgi:hypothetical protein
MLAHSERRCLKMKDLESIKMVCSCRGRYIPMVTQYKGVEVRGWKCKKCHDILLHPVDVQRVLEVEQAKKDKKLDVKVRKINRSLVVTIPEILTKKIKPGITASWSLAGENRFNLDFI